MSNMSQQQNTNSPISGFLISLLIGLAGGAMLLGAGQIVSTNTELVTQTAVFLNLSEKTAWYFTRATGTVAYLLLTASTIWGLLLSSKIIKETVPAMLSLAMHNFLSWTAIGITGLHMVALLFDTYYTYTISDLLIPFIGPYRPEWVGLGVIGFYLMLLTSLSFYWRKFMGQLWWKRLHMLTFVAYLLITAHGITAGTDSGSTAMNTVYWGSGLLVLFLTNYRILTARSSQRQKRNS
ncbi:MAG: hypothetical protein GY943_13480 [Chloroflexi bacterium]|nr:hypothetical protein [Chloroflexota bacterium]